jgi:twitching motility protein PilI
MDQKFGSLRDYQERLLQRINAQRESASASSYLALEIGGEPWVVRLADLSEVMPVPVLTLVPNTQSWFLGITNVRGILNGVADLAAFMGLQPVAAGTETRLVLVHPKYRVNTGFLVTRSLGLRKLQSPFLPAESDSSWMSGQYTESDGRTWKELNIRRLVATPAFLEIAEQVAAA